MPKKENRDENLEKKTMRNKIKVSKIFYLYLTFL